MYAYVVNNPVRFWDALGQCADARGNESNIGILDVAGFIVLAVLAIVAVIGFIAKVLKSQWRLSSVEASLAQCLGALGLAAAAIMGSHATLGNSKTTWNVLRVASAAAGGFCVGLWAIRMLIPEFYISAGATTSFIHIGEHFIMGSSVSSFVLAGAGLNTTINSAAYIFYDMISR